jgi:dTDP-4-dehydrorhamnose reductase
VKLLILSDTSRSCDKHGLRAALSEQFQEHKHTIEWLEPGQVLTSELVAADEPTLVIDCLGGDGNPCMPWLTEELFAQLIAHCNERDWIWLLLSDSRVFSPLHKRRFVETDAPAPSLPAGRQLLMRENYIADMIDRHIVLRVGPVIASGGDNLLTHVLQQFRAGGPVVVPDTQRFCPTPAADVARVIAAIHAQLDCGAVGWGAYHYESADPVTGYEFAEVVLAAAAQYWPVNGGSVALHSAAVDTAADVFPLLNCQRIRDTFGIQQLPWRKAIPNFLKQIYADNSVEAKSL